MNVLCRRRRASSSKSRSRQKTDPLRRPFACRGIVAEIPDRTQKTLEAWGYDGVTAPCGFSVERHRKRPLFRRSTGSSKCCPSFESEFRESAAPVAENRRPRRRGHFLRYRSGRWRRDARPRVPGNPRRSRRVRHDAHFGGRKN